jgi:hypothetical protein
MTSTPPPGSKEAQVQGCKCPVIDNHYGKGIGNGLYYINERCALHTHMLHPADRGSQPQQEGRE